VIRRLLIFAKLVSCGAAVALIVPFFFATLLLAMNGGVRPGPLSFLLLWGILAAVYGPVLLVGLPLAFACVRFFAARDLALDWFHLKIAVWFTVVGTSGAVALLVWNLMSFGDLLGARGRLRLSAALLIVLAGWITSLVLAGRAQWKKGDSGTRRLQWAAAVLVATAPLSLLSLLIPQLPPPPPPATIPEVEGRGGSVVVLVIEGATFSEILPLASEGRLPNLSRMLKEGARGPLRSVRPCRFQNAWATLSTGKLPPKHGILDNLRYAIPGLGSELRALPKGLFLGRLLHPGILSERPVGESDLRVRPLWQILDRLRVEAVFLGWPLAAGSPSRGSGDAADEREKRVADWIGRIAGGEALTVVEESALARAIGEDLSVHEALQRVLWSTDRPRFAAASLPGLSQIGAIFPHLRHPESGGLVPGEEGERHGGLLDRYYEMLDQFLGQVRSALSPGDSLLLVSPYGTEPLGARARLARRIAGLPPIAAGHDAGPAGILVLDGEGVSPGKQLDDLKLTDVVPLTLYVLGLPVARDMDGRLPKRLFQRSFLEAYPITLIPTYG